MSNPQSRAHRKPPDVEEALSSMLWTPYDNNVSESDSADETEALHRINNNNNNNNNGSNCYSFFGSGPNQDHRRHQHQQSLMRRSLSAWSYRNRTGKSPSPGESEVGNRYSYPYYDQPELGVALGGGFSGGWYGISGNSSSATTTNNNYYYGINGSSYGYGLPVTSSRSSYSFHPELAAAAAVDPSEARAPWQTLTVSGEDRGTEKRPYLQQRQRHQQLQTPFVGRWQTGVGASQLETSSLPFSLLALDSPAAAVGGRRSTTIATDGTALVGPSGREVDGFADSYQDDYQVCAGAAGQGENMAAGSNTDSNINSINNNIDGTCSNNSLCIISAMFLEPGDSGGGGGGGVGGGNLHFPGEQQHRQGHGKSTAATPAGPQHNPSITTTTTTTTALLPLLTCGVGGRVGSPDAASIARTPPCSTAAEGSERTTTAGPASAYGSGPFTCVRQANAAASPSVRRADGFRGELDRVDQQQQQNKATSPHRVPAMRLNVPAAGLAEGSRTSVYIPSTGDGVGGGGGAGGLHPALTIQVNRLDPNNQQQNDVVNNAASGVSIVSCYRAAASVGGGGQAVPRAEDCGAAGGPKCSVPGGDRERVRGVAGEECEAAADRKRDLGELVGGVNTSDVNCSPEQMVQVSSVEERLHVAGDVGANGGGGGGGDRCPSSGPHSASPPRTFTSTEAQTDETIQQSQQLQQQQFLLQHPASAAASFIGSPTGPTGGPEPAIVTTMLGPGSEFSTREHRRRERRERRLARNRLQHIHPLEPPGPAPAGPGLLHRSPPPIEIIPDILHSHLPPPYTTLPMGASLIPQMIPANAVAAAAAAAAAIPVRAADDCRYTFPIPIMRR
uniref:Uncharacterized protein n=1 Tax=Anopheles dirus TaxID=7168 RepID=A0A182N835_9DIPT